MVAAVLSLGAQACTGDIVGGDDDVEESVAPDVIDQPPPMGAGDLAAIDNTDGRTLRLRSEPSVDSAIIDQMPEGEIVEVLDAPEGNWYPVAFDEQSGWAHGHYLTRVEDGGDEPQPDGGETPEPPVDGHDHLLPWTAAEMHRVTQGHHGGSHTGYGAWAWDFGMPTGTILRAGHDGVVRRTKSDSTTGGCSSSYASQGNYVVVDRGDGIETLYLHLSEVAVAEGQAVRRGDILGKSGATGWACGPHLHYQIQQSPSGGGTTSWYNPSVQDFFHDHGEPIDPPVGAEMISANLGPVAGPSPGGDGLAAAALQDERLSGELGDPASDPHGAVGPAWDSVMRADAR